MPDLLFQPTPHTEASAYIASKSVVSRAVFNGLLPELKARAFVVQGIEDANTVQQIRDLVAQLPAGANWKEQKKQIAALASPFFVDPDADEETRVKQQAAAERKAELLLRTHGGQAYSAAAWQVQQRQKKVFPFWKYQSMGDGHVRESHAALDGVVLPADHEFWKNHYPPWAWGCRCLVLALSRDDYEDEQRADEEKPLMERSVLKGTRLRRLEQERKINLGPNSDVDLRSDAEKGKEHGYSWEPGDLHLKPDDLKKRYDPEVWSLFREWAEKQNLNGNRPLQTVWEWLTKPRPVKTFYHEDEALAATDLPLANLPENPQSTQYADSPAKGPATSTLESAAFVARGGGPPNPGHAEPSRTRRERVARESQALLDWSRDNGFLREALPEPLQQVQFRGGEHLVSLEETSQRFFKATREDRQLGFGAALGDFVRGATPSEYLDRLALQNELFGDDVRLEGIRRLSGGRASIITSQPAITGRAATSAEIDELMHALAYERVGEGAYYAAKRGLLLFDVFPRNVLIDGNDVPHVIDPVVQRVDPAFADFVRQNPNLIEVP